MKEDSNSRFFKDVLKQPKYAWPTIILFLVSIIGWFLSLGIGLGFVLPFGLSGLNFLSTFTSTCSLFFSLPITVICFLLSTACSYAMFTVMHDAVHGAISSNKRLNNAIGAISAMWMGPTNNWHGFKLNHLTHHAHTNVKGVDPDMWASNHGFGGKKLLPLRWLTVDFAYLYKYIINLPNQKLSATIIDICYEISMISFLILMYNLGFTGLLMQYWIIPSRIAIMVLAYAFDYLPHSPHETTRHEDKFRTTAYISTPWYTRWLLSTVIFFQNYHVIHHLYPMVPYYRYCEVWELQKKKLLNENKIPVKHVLTILGEEDLPFDKRSFIEEDDEDENKNNNNDESKKTE